MINPITAITGSTVGGIVDPKLAPIKRLVIAECLAVAAADGVTFDEDFMTRIDEVFGSAAVVALGEKYGISCPVNAALTTIIKQLEAQSRRG